MAAALDDGNGGDQGQFCFFLQLWNGQRAAVAHGGADFAQRQTHVILERACVWNIGVNALFEGQFLVTAQVVSLPVSCAGRTFAPVFLHIVTVDVDLVGWAFVKACKVTTQHDEVGAHCQSQGHVVVLYDTAVRADWNIDAGLFEVFVTGFGYLNYCGCLSTTDTLLLTGDEDGAAADADLNKVCACFCQEEEAFAVYYVTCADLNGVAVFCTNEVDGAFLPLGEALGGVDAQYVCTGFYQSRYTLFIVAGVDTGADYIAFERSSPCGIQSI